MQQRMGASRLTRRVAGREADLIRAELAAQPHPLLVDERLDGAGVDGPLPARERGEQHRRRDQRLAGAGRRVQDDVLAVEQLENRLFLGRVEGEALAGGVLEEAVEEHVAGRVPRRVGQEVGEGDGHRVLLYRETGAAVGFRACFSLPRGRSLDDRCRFPAWRLPSWAQGVAGSIESPRPVGWQSVAALRRRARPHRLLPILGGLRRCRLTFAEHPILCLPRKCQITSSRVLDASGLSARFGLVAHNRTRSPLPTA